MSDTFAVSISLHSCSKVKSDKTKASQPVTNNQIHLELTRLDIIKHKLGERGKTCLSFGGCENRKLFSDGTNR